MDVLQKLRGIYERDTASKQTLNRERWTREIQNKKDESLLKDERGRVIRTIDDFFDRISLSPPKDLDMKTLDRYSRTWSEESFDLKIVISNLPSKTIYRELGRDALYWSWANNIHADSAERQLRTIGKLDHKDIKSLEQARLNLWRKSTTHYDSEAIRANYDFRKALLRVRRKPIELSEILPRYAKLGIALSPNRIQDYDILPATTINPKHTYSHSRIHFRKSQDLYTRSLYIDNPVALVLMYQGKPNAIISAYAISDKTLLINQVQGVQPFKSNNDRDQEKLPSRGLMPIRWKELMIDVLKNISHELGYTKIAILHGNKVAKQNDGNVHMTIDEAKAKYDNLAKQLGYKRGFKGYFYQDIKATPSSF